MDVRVAMKSLPSDRLLDEICQRIGTNKLMVFNVDYLKLMCKKTQYSDILMGKPLPFLALHEFYDDVVLGGYNEITVKEVQWLADSVDRINEYGRVAEKYGRTLKINLELDVGIHRGGFDNAGDIDEALKLLKEHPVLEFSGLMGYEKHIYYLALTESGRRRALQKCLGIYRQANDLIARHYGHTFLAESATLNAAGSVTYQLYDKGGPANEFSIGSGFVKPTHFDTKTLVDHEPAAFIATPLLKRSPTLNLPVLGQLSGLMSWWNRNMSHTYFVYGGHWDATVDYPKGLIKNRIYGPSSNQECYTGSSKIQLAPNDYVFLRPNESEAVFTQFGYIAIYEGDEITEYWDTLPPAP
jgi:D-serine deaminase-like pyridoxal phosphate-dependent protein